MKLRWDKPSGVFSSGRVVIGDVDSLTHKVCIMLFAAVFFVVAAPALFAEERAAPQSIAEWTARLQGEDLQVRRDTAVATRSADRAVQEQLLPVLIDRLMNEKDGQVRLAVFETVTDLGPAAESAIPALVHTLRTDYGGKSNEERHQDYRSAVALGAIGPPAVEALRGLLNERRANVRAEAAMALGRIGAPAAAAAEDLIGLLDDEEQRVRREAVSALGRLGDAALEPLLAATRHEQVAVRAGAIEALGLLSPSDDRAVEAVLHDARTDDPAVRAAAVKSLAGLQASPDAKRMALLESLRHDDPAVRTAAVNVLTGERTLLEQVKPDLCDLLTGAHDGAAWHAAFLLQNLGPSAAPELLGALPHQQSRIEQIARALALLGRPAVGLLTEALDAPEPRVRQGAALALGQIRPLPENVITRLAAGLDDADRDVQTACLTSIGRLGPRARAAVPAVRTKLRDPSAALREQAIGVLFAAAPRDGRLIEELAALVDDPDPRVQQRAIDTLRAAGPLGRPALAAVIEKLESPDANVRRAAAAMIGSHGRAAAAAVGPLAALLDEADADLRVVVTQTLSQFGVAARPALDKLTVLVNDENAHVRAAAVQTLANLELPAEQLRTYFSPALRDDDYDVRRAALGGIRRLGQSGAIFVPDLIALLANDRQGDFVKRSLERYERYGVDSRSIPELVELLKHDHNAVKLQAVKFLGLAGPAAKESLPLLRALSEGADDDLRAQIAAAIANIQGDAAASPKDDNDQRGR